MSSRGQCASANEPTSFEQDPHHPSLVETNLGSGKERRVDHQAAREPGQAAPDQLADLIDTVERLRAQVEAMGRNDSSN
jgi:hypothetical protein